MITTTSITIDFDASALAAELADPRSFLCQCGGLKYSLTTLNVPPPAAPVSTVRFLRDEIVVVLRLETGNLSGDWVRYGEDGSGNRQESRLEYFVPWDSSRPARIGIDPEGQTPDLSAKIPIRLSRLTSIRLASKLWFREHNGAYRETTDELVLRFS